MKEVLDFLMQNGAELLLSVLAVAKIIVRLTPTKKDDKIFGYLDDLISFFISDNKAKKDVQEK
jgi:hypothetical protein